MKPIVILSGPPGSGKTTVAAELVAISRGPVAYIEGDKFWGFIAKRDEMQEGNESFKMIMRSMLAASLHYALNGYETILDFSIPPWFMDAARAVAKFKNLPLDYVVIRPDKAICAARAANRPEGKLTDYTQYHELYQLFDKVPQYIIYDNEGDAKTIAAKIREGLDEGIFRISK